MKLSVVLTFILVMTLTIACISSGGPTSTPLDQPESINIAGPYVHDASGLVFPANYKNYFRRSLTRFDTESYNVGATYDLLDFSCPLLITVYIRPSPRILSVLSPPDLDAVARDSAMQEHFEGLKSSILAVHPTAELVAEQEVVLPNDSIANTGLMASFEYTEIFGGVMQDLLSHVYVFCYIDGKWTVKYRITHPKDVDASHQIEEFIRSIPWE